MNVPAFNPARISVVTRIYLYGPAPDRLPLPLTAPRRTQALAALCDQLTQTRACYPGTDLVLRYEVKPTLALHEIPLYVRSPEAKLHRWAGEDSSRRFGDLFNLVYDPAFLVHAWERVSTNRGAQTAGIDKATAAMIETGVGVGVFLGQIRDSLKSGEFGPVEVRRVMIPKGTSGKFRKLGIPTEAA